MTIAADATRRTGRARQAETTTRGNLQQHFWSKSRRGTEGEQAHNRAFVNVACYFGGGRDGIARVVDETRL